MIKKSLLPFIILGLSLILIVYHIMVIYCVKGIQNMAMPGNMNNRGVNRMYTTDFGPEPFAVNIERATVMNNNYRTALWTGEHLQLTLMSIPVNGDIGLEMHPEVDQFIRIEDGDAIVKMGSTKDKLNYQARLNGSDAVIVPAGTWHNIINIGDKPLKLYSIYAPPNHPFGTVQETKETKEA
ncbi:MAG: cupin domain-containing protein [Candidatus Metalachnospira sp.]|nr:cupin domain-containing protein [Candidatus Metalachnospira sp.]